MNVPHLVCVFQDVYCCFFFKFESLLMEVVRHILSPYIWNLYFKYLFTYCIDVPLVPKIEYFTVEGRNVLLKFKPNCNGGLHQQFVVEYRKTSDQNWTRAGIINDTFQDDTILYRLPLLEPDWEYCVQIYSVNAIGQSDTTEVCSINTHVLG